MIEQIFDVLVRDCSRYALQLYSKTTTTALQMEYCLRMIRKPVDNPARYQRLWKEHVHARAGRYEMNP